jgi:hypothetical protein
MLKITVQTKVGRVFFRYSDEFDIIVVFLFINNVIKN